MPNVADTNVHVREEFGKLKFLSGKALRVGGFVYWTPVEHFSVHFMSLSALKEFRRALDAVIEEWERAEEIQPAEGS
jgi:hypothetical protein